MHISRLSLISFSHRDKRGSKVGKYLCICGKEVFVNMQSVKTGNTKSCGCLQKELQKQAKYVNHGKCNTPTYKSWMSMKRRCTETDRIHHHGRGITYCQRWEKFENFLSDMGERPAGTTIDRINNNGNYEPNNCRWTTAKEQANNRSNSIKLKYNDKDITIYEWEAISGIPYATINSRLKNGWDMQKAMYTPINKNKWSNKKKLG